MKTAGQLISEKSLEIWSVGPSASVYDGLRIMSEENLGALMVLKEGHLVGIFSERDYARKVILKGKSSRDLLVRDIMSTSVTTVEPEESIDECMALMTEQYIRHLPVVKDNSILGMISITDVVRAIISEQRLIIDQLESYIRERKQYAETLKQREAELQAILDTAVDGIITIDGQGAINSFNPAAARIFGYQAEEVLGSPVEGLLSQSTRKLPQGNIVRFLLSEDRQVLARGREVVGRRKDGSTFPLYVAVSEQGQGDQLRFTGIVRDLTDFKRMQRKVLQAETLAAIGEMAASIAHEIKNPLAGIGGAIEVLEESMGRDDPRREVMQEILGQVDRLDRTVRQLLMLSKPWVPDRQACNIRTLLERLIRVLKKREPYQGIDFSFSGAKSLRAVVDPSLFEQVIRNLLDNSLDAMPAGGEVKFGLKETPDAAVLQVQDTGVGVPTELHGRLFRPFFTTKTRGTGLGLSICKKIMDAHEGSIRIASHEGQGTKVVLTFPRGG
jgi:PAS domain S-box-containing protein